MYNLVAGSHIIIKCPLFYARLIFCRHPHKILSRLKLSLIQILRGEQALNPQDRLLKGIILCQLKRIINILSLKIIRSIPRKIHALVCHLRNTDKKRLW